MMRPFSFANSSVITKLSLEASIKVHTNSVGATVHSHGSNNDEPIAGENEDSNPSKTLGASIH